MTEAKLRSTLSVVLLSAHIAIPSWIFALYLAGGFLLPELTQLMQIVLPGVAAPSTLAIAYIIDTKKARRRSKNSPPVSALFAAATLGASVLAAVLVVVLVSMKAWNVGVRSFADLKLALATIETLFGAYSAKLLASLFQQEKTS